MESDMQPLWRNNRATAGKSKRFESLRCEKLQSAKRKHDAHQNEQHVIQWLQKTTSHKTCEVMQISQGIELTGPSTDQEPSTAESDLEKSHSIQRIEESTGEEAVNAALSSAEIELTGPGSKGYSINLFIVK